MKLGSKILAFLTVFVLIFSGYAATPAQATGMGVMFSLHKTDMEGNALQGAVYKIEFQAGANWFDTTKRMTTDANGNATSGYVPLVMDTNFRVVEIKAPDGYALDRTPSAPVLVTCDKNGQTISLGDFKNVRQGKLTIVKHDSEIKGKVLPGATFVISKCGEPVATVVTDKDGSVTCWLDPYGDYTVTEAIPPIGYLADSAVKTGVSVTSGGSTTLDFYDTRMRCVVDVFKDIVCYVGPGYHGTTFSFKLTNVETKEEFTGSCGGELVAKIIVPYGMYKLEETDIPSGFKFLGFTDNLIPVELFPCYIPYRNVTCHNGLAGNLLITKDDGAGHGLIGAKFDIYSGNCADGPWTPVINDATTDKDGHIHLNGQLLGWYKVVETAAPFGYEAPADNDMIKQLCAFGNTETFAFHDAQLFGSITVNKAVIKDTNDNSVVPPFKVKIVGPTDNPNAGCAVYTYPITEGPTPIIGLAYGTYTIEEVDLPTDYSVSSPNPQTFTINGEHANDIVVNITNTKLYGDLTVTKSVKDGAMKEGESFAFELYKGTVEAGEVPYRTQTISYPDTTCVFEDLPYGSYTLREVKSDGFMAVADVPVTVDSATESAQIENTRVIGSIRVTKAFAGTEPETGTKFTFRLTKVGSTDPAIVKTLTWGPDEKSVLFEGLDYGATYNVTEDIKEGYAIDEQFAGTGKAVTITGDVADKQLTCTNTMLGKIELTKVDSFDNAPLSGAVFTVTPPAGAAFTLATDDSGKITSGWLKPGKYTVQETTAPDGYHIDEPDARTVSVTGGGTAKETFADSLGSILILKRSSYGEKPVIKGVVFQLMSKDPAGAEPAADTIVGEATTNDKGIARFDRLLIGHNYWVREIQQAAGYDINKLDVRTVVPSYMPTKPAAEFENNPLGTIRITKTDSADSTKLLAGAVFGIYSDSNFVNLVQTMPATGDDGVATSDPLPFGGNNPASYYVKEITAPTGYVLNDEARATVAFTEPGQVVALSFTNTRNAGSLIIKKVDSFYTDKTLAGAEFKLYSDEAMTKQVGAAVTTEVGGIVRFDNLTPGNYWLMETVAPTNYDPMTEPVPVTVTAGVTEPEPIVITNQYNPPEDIQTGMMDWNILLIGGLALVAGGLMLFLTRRRSRHATK